ncbi:ROK family protein [Leifsonia sp. L25]|uniref:ROK family protein n=1 Tax=Leifsonia sp. L25 TaxID=3423957 RepID=UPI003D682C51
MPVVRAEDVVAAAAAGDPLATELWDETVDVLSVALTDLVNVFEPDLVVLGGGVTRSGDALLVPVRERVAADAMPPAAAASTVVLAGLGDVVRRRRGRGRVRPPRPARRRGSRPEGSPHV